NFSFFEKSVSNFPTSRRRSILCSSLRTLGSQGGASLPALRHGKLPFPDPFPKLPSKLLKSNFATSFLHFLLECFRVLLLHAGFQHGRSRLDERLGLCETERESFFHCLDDGNFLLACRGKLDIEFRLFFRCRASCRAGCCYCCRRDSPLFLDSF